MPDLWTDARIRKLTELWSQGASTRDIARSLGGGISRNAVIGKANRLGLKRPDEEKDGRRPFSFPGPLECRWSTGQPDEEDFDFCREPVLTGKPYCAEHCELAYRKKS